MMHITPEQNKHNCQLCKSEWLGRCFNGSNYGKDVSVDNEPCNSYEFGGTQERLAEIEKEEVKRLYEVKFC
jgi:hypothetical protein